MDKREFALSILKQSRKLLTHRLVDSVVETADGILEDAEGLSYMDEIGTLQEKVGDRLNRINLMIANFPKETPSTERAAEKIQEDSEAPTISHGLGAPKLERFALFSQQVVVNDLDSAGQTLADLLDVDQSLGLQCATAFRKRLDEDPVIIQKTMLLRTKLMAGENNDSLMILWDCFRLQGLQAVEVLQTLKARLSAA